MDHGIFTMCTDVNACDCTRGCADTVKQSALKVDCRRKIPCHTGVSNLRWWRAGPLIYQLRYIPTHAGSDVEITVKCRSSRIVYRGLFCVWPRAVRLRLKHVGLLAALGKEYVFKTRYNVNGILLLKQIPYFQVFTLM